MLVEPAAPSAAGAGPWRLRTSLRLRGLDVTSDAVLIYDDEKAEVHAISRSGDEAEFVPAGQLDARGSGGVRTQSASAQRGGSGRGGEGGGACGGAMALIGESVFRLAGDKVEVCNFGGGGPLGWGPCVDTGHRND